jgi:pilus assembly protein Flp/PilA
MMKEQSDMKAMDRFCRIETLASLAGRRIGDFVADESGATAIEYGMVASGVAVCIAGTVWNLGSTLKTTFYDKLAALFP